jgi:S-adenosylmethionine-dependent methyltransferase
MMPSRRGRQGGPGGWSPPGERAPSSPRADTAFAGHEGRWQARLGKLRDVVRQELVTRQLAAELAPPPVRIIDLGCGQGTQALALARRGYEVTGVDASAELLARFEQDLAAEPAEVRARVRVEHGLIEDWAERSGVSRAEAVLCHGVLMYAADPDPLLRAVARLTAPGGMTSLLVRNGDGLAMRPGLLGDWVACAAALSISGGSVTYANRIGVTARADRLADLTGRLAGHGLEVTAWYGVRVFTDTASGDAEPPPELEALLACEERAGHTDPYRGVAALLHVIARRPG